MPVNEGPCNRNVQRYFFNAFKKDCEAFRYSGCGGNENNFMTYDSCKRTCVNILKEHELCKCISYK